MKKSSCLTHLFLLISAITFYSQKINDSTKVDVSVLALNLNHLIPENHATILIDSVVEKLEISDIISQFKGGEDQAIILGCY
ncbi:hypothetical protein [Chryseobacterium balustinum]|uniref:DUF4347 domain-containing protein n=1 Tax=Chryseobacterium balustinum TaxID=246 RepID=A0AAX2ISG3_9FLAO|nr:hypothetical protein [Chryseobacterium balustinum]SKB89435.1 hypothetical protein SAMN05421800_1131 [Chryseobacterium balustinum]SQA92764.1 Uncharacterised protein [Chryseobacterium balustinum]